jgi:uncharacterized protein YrrD
MTPPVRARDLIGRPVVTLDGDDLAQIKDVVYAEGTGSVLGFTLAGRSLLSGPMRQRLPWKHVHAVGRDAVMIVDRGAFRDFPGFSTADAADQDVLGDTAVTTGGAELGTVADVIIEFGVEAEVIGFELITRDQHSPDGHRVLVPRSGAHTASGRTITVADDVFAADDLAGLARFVRRREP